RHLVLRSSSREGRRNSYCTSCHREEGGSQVSQPSPNTALHRTPSAAPPSPVSFRTLGDAQRLKWLAVLALLSTACVSSSAAPSEFGRWGTIVPVAEPERSVIQAALATLPEPSTMVLARYAGSMEHRLDLGSLDGQPVSLDSDARLARIGSG